MRFWYILHNFALQIFYIECLSSFQLFFNFFMFVLFQNTGFFNEMDHNPDGEELDCDYVLLSGRSQSPPDYNDPELD